MLELQTKLHGAAGPLRVDYTIMLNRRAGATGRTWHSHNYGPDDTLTHDGRGPPCGAVKHPSRSPQ